MSIGICAGVLHYRNWPGVGETIDCLLSQTRPPDRILVFDHASGDGSADQIRAGYPTQVKVVEAPANRGPAGGMASLVDATLAEGTEAVFILPDDMEFEPDALERLEARLEQNPELGAVGPLIAHKRDPDRVFYAGGYLDARTWDLQLRGHPASVSEWAGKPPHATEFLTGSGLLIRSQAARDAGPLPGHFYKELDDVDFVLRLAAAGWTLELVPGAVGRADFGERGRETVLTEPSPYLSVRNRLGLVARNAPRRILVREIARTVKWLIWDAVRPRSGSRTNLKPRFRGLLDFCRGRWGPPPAGT